jgi:hypothetical protein
MSDFSGKALFWAPRVLSIAFIAFLSLFALDVFDGRLGFWQTVLALLIHLIPVFVLIAVLILAWRWEWVGAVLYAAAGLLYIVQVVSGSHSDYCRSGICHRGIVSGQLAKARRIAPARAIEFEELGEQAYSPMVHVNCGRPVGRLQAGE